MKRLRQLRKERGITQQQMADMLGIDRSTYTKYETRISEPNIATLRRLATFFDVTIDYLLGQSDDPRSAAELAAFAPMMDTPLSDLSAQEREELADFARYLLSKRDKN